MMTGVMETSCYFFIVDFSFKMCVEIDRYQDSMILPITTEDKTLRSVHFAVVVVELIKCGGIVRNQIW